MKLFVLGIDGFSPEIINTLDMPFLNLFSKENKMEIYCEDLETRGWAKIYSGELAHQNRSFYEYMSCDGSYKWLEKFNSAELDNTGSQPIWDYLNNLGLSVGIMNVPTAAPVRPVNGFWVAGGGGGSVVENIANANDVFPRGEVELLRECGYIKDERFNSLVSEKKLVEINDFLGRLMEMTEKRVDVYLKLNEKYKVNFGFLVMRSIVVVHFLFAFDIVNMVKKKLRDFSKHETALYEFHRNFDYQLKRLIDGLGAESCIITADHGMTVLKKKFNINKLLVNIGYQVEKSSNRLKKYFVTNAKKIISSELITLIKGNTFVTRNFADIVPFDSDKTVAFTFAKLGTMHGIFINDSTRFHGPVSPNAREKLAMKICADINSHEAVVANGIHATIHPHLNEGQFGHILPDILLDMPSYIKPVSWGDFVFNEVDFSKAEANLSHIQNAHYSGVKDKATIVMYSNSLSEYFDRHKGGDLREIHKVIKSFFGG